MEHRISRRRKDSRFPKKRVLLVLLAVIIAAVLLCIGVKSWVGHQGRLAEDASAIDSSQKPLSESEMLKKIQEEADASAFRFKMNSEVAVTWETSAVPNSPEAPSGESSRQTAQWNIINSIENSYNMQVTVTGEDGATLYESRVLHPGEQDLNGLLEIQLEPGTYQAEATAKALDPETEKVLGTVTAELTLHVEE